MPVPGPRTQFRADPGYNNPEHRQPTFFNLWKRPAPIAWPGESAGLGVVSRRGNILAAGQIRRLWKQSVNLINGPQPYSWTFDGPQPGRQNSELTQPVDLTRATRYQTSMLYMRGGNDNSRFEELHTTIASRHNSKPVTHGKGGRNNPTTRNRMTSFGSRVPVLNPQVQAAQVSS